MSDPFRVQIIDDHEIENYENFYLSFSIPESASSCGAIADENTEMEVHVRDDDGMYSAGKPFVCRIPAYV